MDGARAHKALLSWYDRVKRELPWRDVDDPYAVWVSEVMLQQTRVETVVPYFLRWMERFPDVATLARAPREDVLRSWQGLGYYSRARALHEAAGEVARAHGGRLPDTREGLLGLRGIGPYTAGAVASIAFGERVAAVDGNVSRVLARLGGHAVDVTSSRGRRVLWEVAASLVPRERPGDWNQALMELGATVCTPRGADCGGCPLRSQCVAFEEGRVDDLPVRTPKRPPREQEVRLAWVERDGHVLLARAPDTGLLAGLWGLPGGEAARPLAAVVRRQTGLRVRAGAHLGAAEHRFTHRLWRMEVRRCTLIGAMDGSPGEAETAWAPLDRLGDWPVATAHRKAMSLGLPS